MITILSDKESKLVEFISSKLNLSKKKAKEIIDQKRVFVNNKIVWISSYTIKPNDLITILSSKDGSYEIIYQDDDFIVISKGPNIVVDQEKLSLENILKKDFQNQDIKAIHRIDKDTTGLVLFAKNIQVFEYMKKNWKNVQKIYYCISYNEANFDFREIDLPIDGKIACSTVVNISKKNGLSLFKVRIFTGRKHQIRIHLSKIGYPILGDYIYGPKKSNILVNRPMLHSYKIEFDYKGKTMSFVSPLPSDMKGIILKYRL